MTQELDVLGQLRAGARYLDIRPVISNADFYTGHYSKTDQAGWQGSAGQSINEVIDNINDFTASNSELVILYLSHSANTDTEWSPFDASVPFPHRCLLFETPVVIRPCRFWHRLIGIQDDEWNSCLYRFYNNLNNLWAVDTADALTSISLSTFISNGAAVVIVVDERDKSYLDSKAFTGRGFFPKSAFPKSDSYANNDNLDKVREDQYTKLSNFNANPGQDQVFILDWTITVSLLLPSNSSHSCQIIRGSSLQCETAETSGLGRDSSYKANLPGTKDVWGQQYQSARSHHGQGEHFEQSPCRVRWERAV